MKSKHQIAVFRSIGASKEAQSASIGLAQIEKALQKISLKKKENGYVSLTERTS